MSSPDRAAAGWPDGAAGRGSTEAAALAGVSVAATAVTPDLVDLAERMAGASARFIAATEGIAGGRSPASAFSVLLIELSSVLAAGAGLGAIEDVVPAGRWEPDAGDEPDIDNLRMALAEQFGDIDEYTELFDPYVGDEAVPAWLSDDLATITSDLLHGLAHYAAGRTLEALWWWQHSYLSSWGQAASAGLRAVQSLVNHVRLDAALGPVPAEAD